MSENPSLSDVVARLDALERENRELRGELARLRPPAQAAPEPATVTPLSRRRMLGSAAAAAMGAAAGAVALARPAAAADNDPLTLGAANSSTLPTTWTHAGSNGVSAAEDIGLKIVSSGRASAIYAQNDVHIGVEAKSDVSMAIRGISNQVVGVWGECWGGDGTGHEGGVYGVAKLVAPGVWGDNEGTGVGVKASALTGDGLLATSNSGKGVNATSSSNTGVAGTSTSGSGVAGTSTSGSGVAGTSTSGAGVAGTSSTSNGVSGTSTSGAGVAGTSSTSNGVIGTSTSGTGARGTSTSGTGVHGSSSGSGARGVLGEAPSGKGVQGTGVNGGEFTGTARGLLARGTVADIKWAAAATTSPTTRQIAAQRGDTVSTTDGTLWYCVTGGTPGTWVKLAAPTAVGLLHLLTRPARVYDSRPGQVPTGVGPKTPLLGGSTITVDCTKNSSGVPADARGVVLNVTVTGTTGALGWVTVYPSNGTLPTVSTLNWDRAGATIANAATIACGPGATIKVNNGAAGTSTNVMIDVTGFYR
jgi:hypothetical protein